MRRARAVLLAAALIVPVAAGTATAQTAAETTTARTATDHPHASALQALHVDHGGTPTIVDAAGRQVLLRGIDLNSLGDYWQQDPALPTVYSFGEPQAAAMAAQGFDVIRLVLSWSRLEPTRGAFDTAYLDQMRAAVRLANAHGMYVVLDMHQDAWGKEVATAPGQTCPPPTSTAQGWDGAPAWATYTDGLTHCRLDKREFSPAVLQAFTNFWVDRAGIQTEFVRTWARLAAAFAADPGVAGYDLFNEPHPGWAPPATSTVALGRFYARTITAIRAAERTARGGFAHLVFFEPTVVWSGVGVDAVPPPGFTTDRDIVFAPHLYAESINLDTALPTPVMTIERAWQVAAAVAATYDAPLWVGEWGFFDSTAGPKLRRFVAAENAHVSGGAYWQWRQACGDPHHFYGGDPPITPGYIPTACPSGAALATPDAYRLPLTEAYPRALPGRIATLTANPDTGGLTVTGQAPAGRCGVDLWVPDRDTAPTVTGLARTAVSRVAGGWRVRGCVAAPDYTITVAG